MTSKYELEVFGGLPRAVSLMKALMRLQGLQPAEDADHRSQATHQATAGPDGLSGQRMEHATTSVLRKPIANHSGHRPGPNFYSGGPWGGWGGGGGFENQKFYTRDLYAVPSPLIIDTSLWSGLSPG